MNWTSWIRSSSAQRLWCRQIHTFCQHRPWIHIDIIHSRKPMHGCWGVCGAMTRSTCSIEPIFTASPARIASSCRLEKMMSQSRCQSDHVRTRRKPPTPPLRVPRRRSVCLHIKTSKRMASSHQHLARSWPRPAPYHRNPKLGIPTAQSCLKSMQSPLRNRQNPSRRNSMSIR